MRRQSRMAKYPCRLRKMRKASRLSQRELARLLGLRSQGQLSDIEAGVKRPSLEIALASARVFGTSVEDIFPALAIRAERTTHAAALKLHAESDLDQAAAAFLAALIAQLKDSDRAL